MRAFFNWLKPFMGRAVFTLIGFVIAILFLTIGFFKTALITLCCGLGYAAGLYKDKGIRLPEWFLFWRDKF